MEFVAKKKILMFEYNMTKTVVSVATLICLMGFVHKLGCGFPVSFEFPPLPGKPSSVCLATEFA